MRRLAPLLPLFALALAASSLAAQDLQRPDGWNVRFDDPGASEEDLEMFVSMPPGWHVTSGPAAIYWGPEMEASDNYRLEMEVFLFDPKGMREAFGMFAGGRNLEGDDIEYTYFLIRDGREFIVKRREGADAPTIRHGAATKPSWGGRIARRTQPPPRTSSPSKPPRRPCVSSSTTPRWRCFRARRSGWTGFSASG